MECTFDESMQPRDIELAIDSYLEDCSKHKCHRTY